MSAGRLAKDIVATDFPLEDLAAPPVQAMFASFFFFPNAGRLYFRRLADIFSADTVYTCLYIGFLFPTVSLLW